MIKIIIIEDEIPARKKLKRFIEEQHAETQLLAEIDNIAMAIDFLKNTTVDLIFSDIELLDGNAFDIFKKVPVSCPIIFTTAYDQFWMNAFETKGIAYLLKPFSRERFQNAFEKFLLLRNSLSAENKQLSNLTKLMEQSFAKQSYKKRYTVSSHRGFYFIEVETILFFGAMEGGVFAFDVMGKKHLLSELTLKEIEAQLDPSDFFRINRSELISKQHVEKIERYTKNTLSVKMKNYTSYLKTSQSNTASFREWIKQ